MTERVLLEVRPGDAVDDKIATAIRLAKMSHYDFAFTFNGVHIVVNSRTNATSLYRDYMRGMAGYMGENPTIGPDSPETLSPEQLARDEEIRQSRLLGQQRQSAMLVATDNDGFEAIYVDGVLRLTAEPVSARHMQKAAGGVAVQIKQVDVPGVFGDDWPETVAELMERIA